MRVRLMTLLLASAPSLAWAQAPTADQAAVLQKQLRLWFSNLLAPTITLPEPQLKITAEGDKYRLAVPLDALTGEKTDQVTATLRQAEGTRWSVEDVRMPSSGKLAVPMNDSGDLMGTMTYSIGDQAIRMMLDTALATRSTATLELRDVMLRMGGGAQKHEQKFERYAVQANLIPSADGRMDFAQEGTVTGWDVTTQVDDNTAVGFHTRRLRESGRVEGISRDSLEKVVKAIQTLVALNGPGKPSTITDETKAQVRLLIDAARNSIARFEAEETMDDVRIDIPGVGAASLAQLRFGMGAEAPGGRLHAWLDMAFASPDFDGVPKNLRRYLPTRVAFKPAITGVSTDRMFKLLMDAVTDDPDTDKLTADAMTMVTDSGAAVGLEALSLELDALRLEGSGKMRMIAPGKAGIEARLSAAGFDELIANAKKDPELGMAIPFLVMARGLAKPDGARLVWDLAITEDQALVNGVDVMKMGAPQDQAPQKGPDKNSRKR